MSRLTSPAVNSSSLREKPELLQKCDSDIKNDNNVKACKFRLKIKAKLIEDQDYSHNDFSH